MFFYHAQIFLRRIQPVFWATICVACSAAPTSGITPEAVNSTPAGYPGPQTNVASAATTPTFDLARGAITGVLLLSVDGTTRPAANVPIYLAEALKDAGGIERVASYSPVDSPRSTTDADGRFWFYNVKPGRYGLILDAVIQGFLLSKPGTDESLVIEVTRGQTNDLGNLAYESLPLPDLAAPPPAASTASYP